jgi:hypothetical protein
MWFFNACQQEATLPLSPSDFPCADGRLLLSEHIATRY